MSKLLQIVWITVTSFSPPFAAIERTDPPLSLRDGVTKYRRDAMKEREWERGPRFSWNTTRSLAIEWMIGQMSCRNPVVVISTLKKVSSFRGTRWRRQPPRAIESSQFTRSIASCRLLYIEASRETVPRMETDVLQHSISISRSD